MEKQAQKWVKKKKNNKAINSVGNNLHNLTGPLRVENFMSLKGVSLKKHGITSLEISRCLELTEIDLSELTELTSLSVSDCSELNKLACSRSQLASLNLSNNNKLVKLNCSRNRLIELDLSDCPNLIELDCSYNVIKNLIINNDSNITKLNYSDNPPNLDITRKISNYSKLDNCSGLEVLVCREKIRNLLIIGRTGCGKSTLANVLCGIDIFEESEFSVSKTKEFQKQDFEWNGTKYRVVDTIEIGGIKLANNEVLNKIAKGIHLMPEGISQILFLIDRGDLIEKEIKTLGLFSFSGIVKYVTIVRTKFVNFKNEDECEKDRKKLCEGNKVISKIIESRKGIVYVDNPSTNIKSDDGYDERMNSINKKEREVSRTKLLDYLENECQGKYYKLKKWDDLYDKIDSVTDPVSKNLPTIEENSDIAKDVEFALKLEFPFFKISFIAKAKELSCSIV